MAACLFFFYIDQILFTTLKNKKAEFLCWRNKIEWTLFFYILVDSGIVYIQQGTLFSGSHPRYGLSHSAYFLYCTVARNVRISIGLRVTLVGSRSKLLFSGFGMEPFCVFHCMRFIFSFSRLAASVVSLKSDNDREEKSSFRFTVMGWE